MELAIFCAWQQKTLRKLFHSSSKIGCKLLQQVLLKAYYFVIISLAIVWGLVGCSFEMIMMMLLLKLTMDWGLCCTIENYSTLSLWENIWPLSHFMNGFLSLSTSFSGMEMSVIPLLRCWHEYPWRSKEKLKHQYEAWGWKFLSCSFICLRCSTREI